MTDMRHSKPEGRLCTHAAYMLTCDEYEELLNFTGNRCQVCGIPAADTDRGLLSIDHDGMLGQWAVRGLLCQPCNVKIEFPSRQVPEVDAYLAAPWYRVLLDRAGIEGTAIPEPPVGTYISVIGGWIHYRTESGWHTTWGGKRRRMPVTWRALCYKRGPHRIQYGGAWTATWTTTA